jgi:hypothetical protein
MDMGSVKTDLPVTDADSNITPVDSWEAAFAYAGKLSGGPVTVRVAGEPTIYRVTADGRKRALCHTD